MMGYLAAPVHLMQHSTRLKAFKPALRCGRGLLVLSLSGLGLLVGEVRGQHPQDFAPSKPERVEYAAGVHIDWRYLTVELDSRVVFRAGPLELLACSPRTREHESILQIPGRPLSIFQALGLVGLEKGSPVRYDQEKDAIIPPTGQALTLRVLAEFPWGRTTVPTEAWMIGAEPRGKPVEPLNWVFAGSYTTDEGEFGADVDGTLACLVDFSTALIAVGEAHSADNELLWVGADPTFIPREGTRCTLIIHRRAPPALTLHLAADGRLKLADQPASAKSAADAWRTEVERRTGSDSGRKLAGEVAAAKSSGSQEVNPAQAEARHPGSESPKGSEVPVRAVVIELRLDPKVDVKTVRATLDALAGEGVPASMLLVDPRGAAGLKLDDPRGRKPAPR